MSDAEIEVRKALSQGAFIVVLHMMIVLAKARNALAWISGAPRASTYEGALLAGKVGAALLVGAVVTLALPALVLALPVLLVAGLVRLARGVRAGG